MDLETKYNHLAFSENAAERTYLKYFAAGDLQTCWHGRKVRIAMGTTHPAQLRLVEKAFGKYCKPIIYPAKKSNTFCWRIVCNLDKSFRFLFSKLNGLTTEELRDDDIFYSALSGFTDAEGHIGPRGRGDKTCAVLQLCNTNKMILEGFRAGFKSRGIRSGLYQIRRKNGYWKPFWILTVSSKDTLQLLMKMAPRHEEKLEAKNIVITNYEKPWISTSVLYRAFRTRVLEQRDCFISQAGLAYLNRGKKKQQKVDLLKNQILQVHRLELEGSSISQIGCKMQRSERTIYRWLSRYRHRDDFGGQ